jgi:hypothetical protein
MSGGVGQLAAGVAGAAVGFVLGGPMGASIGWSLGAMAGGIIWKADGGSQQGPRLEDRAVQTSAYGTPLPVVWGAYRLAGNIIWAKDIQEVATVKKVGASLFSKGTKVTSYAYYGHFATAICRGPVSGFGRVWADGKLIYDPYTEGKYDGYITFYTGSGSQLPDTAIQADKGVDTTPAFRGTAYLVFKGLPLVDFGNRIPVIHVEIGGAVIEPSARDGALTDIGSGNWSYDAAVPTKAVNTDTTYVTVVDTDTLTAVQFEPIAVTGVSTALIAAFGGTYGPLVDSTDFTRSFMDSSGDVIVILQGTTGYAALCRFSIAGGTPVLVYCKPKSVTIAAGLAYKFGTKIWMADQHSGWVYCYDIATGETDWTKDLSTDVPEAGFSAGQIKHATYDGVHVYFTTYKSGDNTKCGVVKQALATGAIATKRFSFLPAAGLHALTYDATTSSLISICDTQFNRLSTGTLATSNTYTHSEAWTDGAIADNFGTNNAVGGSFWLRSGANFYQYETAGLTLAWSGTVPGTAGSSGDLGNPFPIEGPGRSFFGYQIGTNVYTFGATGSASNLAAIIQDICDYCEMPPDAVDVTALADTAVTGYCVGRESSGRAAIEPLLAAYAVDAPERDGALTFQFRKTDPDATVLEEDLGASASGDSASKLKEVRRQEIEMPISVVCKYSSQLLDYQQGTQMTRRVWEAVESGDPMTVDYPIVLSDQDAKTLSSRLLYLSWIERTSYSFALPPSALLYDPGDVLDIPVDATTAARVLLTKVEIGADGVVECEALATDALAYLPPAEAPIVPVMPAQTVPTAQTATLLVLDAPLLDDADDTFGAYLAGYGSDASWLGADVYVSKDGSTYSYAATLSSAAATGATSTALADHTGAYVDTTNTVRVVFPYAVTLESITELEMLDGGNRCLIGAELLGFQTATQISPTTWDLSDLLRCQQGTEWASDHASGARFVLLEDSVSVEAPLSGLGQTWYWKAVPYGSTLDDVTAQTTTLAGIRIKPLSPVHIAGARDGSDNLTITWDYRARVGADWVDGYETPVDESVEAYEVDVMDGVTVLRTISASSATAAYSAADQTADGLTPGDPVDVNVYQISSRVGRGYAGAATI